MLNFECIDSIESGKVELCFTDSDGDESVKISITQKTAWDIVREIQRKYSYAATKDTKRLKNVADLCGRLAKGDPETL